MGRWVAYGVREGVREYGSAGGSTGVRGYKSTGVRECGSTRGRQAARHEQDEAEAERLRRFKEVRNRLDQATSSLDEILLLFEVE